MRTKCLLVAAVVAAFTFGTAETALAENDATGSLGAVQTGNVGVTPSVGAGEAGAAAAASVPTSVAGAGDNTASNSVGAVQLGGGNTSSNSVGSVQSSPVSSTPTASAGAEGNTASAGVPVTVGGGGSNTSSNSIGGAGVAGQPQRRAGADLLHIDVGVVLPRPGPRERDVVAVGRKRRDRAPRPAAS